MLLGFHLNQQWQESSSVRQQQGGRNDEKQSCETSKTHTTLGKLAALSYSALAQCRTCEKHLWIRPVNIQKYFGMKLKVSEAEDAPVMKKNQYNWFLKNVGRKWAAERRGLIHKYYVCLVQMWCLHWTVFKSWTLQPHVIQQRAVLWEFSSATCDYCD